MKIFYKAFAIVILALAFCSCYTEYYFFIDGSRGKNEYVRVADTLGVGVYLRNLSILNYMRVEMVIRTNHKPVKIIDLSAVIELNDTNYFRVSGLSVFYNDSANTRRFAKEFVNFGENLKEVLKDDKIQNPSAEFTNLNFTISFLPLNRIDLERLKTAKSKIRLMANINGRDVIIERVIPYSIENESLLRE